MKNTVTVPIMRTDQDLRQALERMAEIIEAKPGTPDFDEADVLGTLIQAYEREHDQAPPADPVEAIKFAMEQRGYTWSDLARVLGAPARASEIMNRQRQLTLKMVRALHAEFKIPLDCLIAESTAQPMPRQRPGRKSA